MILPRSDYSHAAPFKVCQVSFHAFKSPFDIGVRIELNPFFRSYKSPLLLKNIFGGVKSFMKTFLSGHYQYVLHHLVVKVVSTVILSADIRQYSTFSLGNDRPVSFQFVKPYFRLQSGLHSETAVAAAVAAAVASTTAEAEVERQRLLQGSKLSALSARPQRLYKSWACT